MTLIKLKSLLNTNEKKKLASNFFSLLTLQGANYILPLLTFPYLVRVLGFENFGLLAFSTAIIAYFQIITDYGFNLTATREISLHRDSKRKIEEIFSSVMTIKLLLLLLCFLFLCTLILLFDKLKQDYIVYLLTFGAVFGQVLFPVWFFQGIERMAYITYINLTAKILLTIAIFVMVQERSHYYLVPLLNALGMTGSGVYALYLVTKKYGINYRFQSLSTLKFYVIDGWHVFLSRIYASLYATTNIIILGLFTNYTAVGYYSIAEKITAALSGIYTPVTQAFYPYFSRLYKSKVAEFFYSLNRFNCIMLISSVFLTIIAFLVREPLIAFVSGEVNRQTLLIFSVLVVSVLTAPFGASFTNGLLVLGEQRLVSKVVRNTLVLNILIVLPLVYLYQALGLAIAVLIRSVFHAINYYFVYTNIEREVKEHIQGTEN